MPDKLAGLQDVAGGVDAHGLRMTRRIRIEPFGPDEPDPARQSSRPKRQARRVRLEIGTAPSPLAIELIVIREHRGGTLRGGVAERRECVRPGQLPGLEQGGVVAVKLGPGIGRAETKHRHARL